MKRIISTIMISMGVFLFVFTAITYSQTNTTNTANSISPLQLILTSNNNQGILNRSAKFVFGPWICTNFGDPFSPNNSPFTDERPYSYKYRIIIPSDYPDDVLRIELFDPDSINQSAMDADVSYTELAINNGFSETPETLACPNPDDRSQIHTCLIKTNEDTLVQTVPGIEAEQVNPIWMVRVDENRGTGSYGNCGQPITYTAEYNTSTLFNLFYHRQNNDGTIEEVPLAYYIGQVGDGSRDLGDHDTDLRWVSPGGSLSQDQTTFVPVDPYTPINPATGQPYSFELNIARDLPGILIDPDTGDRIVHLFVSSLSGASKNTFAVWAGPDDDTDAIPSNVNNRNLYILNNPGSHHSQGVKVLANEALPIQTFSDQGLDMPLIHMGPEYAGKTVYVSAFDLDTGSLPPINFYMDTIAYTPDDSTDGFDETQTDWAVAHGYAGDPNGGCFTNPYSGGCDRDFVTYAITLPSDLECDGSSIDDCTPFYGGQFMTHIQGGSEDELEYDGFTWLIRSSDELPEWDNTQGCTAFPIAVDETIHSVDINSTGENRWRIDFDYPFPSPDYFRFIDHVHDMSLLDAKPGYIYNIQNGDSAGGQGWLAWNQCVADSSALVDSLTWPGNSKDYSTIPGTCILNGETVPRFPGFMEFGDNSDRSMHIGDWVSVNSGSVISNGLIDTLEGHIDLGRTLRVIVYDERTSSGGSAGSRISRFALMRIVGFSLNQGGGESFMMAEFIGWDDSCGQILISSVESVTLNGPNNGLVDTSYTYTATVAPITTTLPITIVWSATDTSPMTQTNQITSTQAFQWSSSGTKTITVTVNNQYGTLVTDTITTTIVVPSIPLTDVIIQPQPEIVGNVVTLTAVTTPTTATHPITYTWQTGSQIITHTTGLTDTTSFSLPYASTQTITVTADNSIGQPVSDTITMTIVAPPAPLTNVEIQPQPEIVGNVVTVTAVTTPTNATRPITYTWQTGSQIITHTTGLTDTASFSLPYSNTQTITVTASNGIGQPVTDTIDITIEPLRTFLPIVMKPDE